MYGEKITLKYTPELANAVHEAAAKAQLAGFEYELPYSDQPPDIVVTLNELSPQAAFYKEIIDAKAKKLAKDIDLALIGQLTPAVMEAADALLLGFVGKKFASGGPVQPSANPKKVGETPSSYLLSPGDAAKLKMSPDALKYAHFDPASGPDISSFMFGGVNVVSSPHVPDGEAYAFSGSKAAEIFDVVKMSKKAMLLAKVESDYGNESFTPVPAVDTPSPVEWFEKFANATGIPLDKEAMGQMKAYTDETVDNSVETTQPVYLVHDFDSTVIPENRKLAIDTFSWELWACIDGKWEKQGFDLHYAAQLSEAVSYAANLRETNKAYSYEVLASPARTVVALYHNGKRYNEVEITHPNTSVEAPFIEKNDGKWPAGALVEGTITASHIVANTLTAEHAAHISSLKLEDAKVPAFKFNYQGQPLDEIIPKWASDATRFLDQCPDILDRAGYLKIAMELWEEAALRQILLSVVAVQGVVIDPKMHSVEVHCVSPQFEKCGQLHPQYSMQIQDYDTIPKFWFEKVEV